MSSLPTPQSFFWRHSLRVTGRLEESTDPRTSRLSPHSTPQSFCYANKNHEAIFFLASSTTRHSSLGRIDRNFFRIFFRICFRIFFRNKIGKTFRKFNTNSKNFSQNNRKFFRNIKIYPNRFQICFENFSFEMCQRPEVRTIERSNVQSCDCVSFCLTVDSANEMLFLIIKQCEQIS